MSAADAGEAFDATLAQSLERCRKVRLVFHHNQADPRSPRDGIAKAQLARCNRD
jgi:hypothetical protein